MSNAFDSIEKGLKEAIAHAHGMDNADIHEVEVPEPDIRAIRQRTGLSQKAFALHIGVKPSTYINWEQGRRRPKGPARILLALIANDPQIVQRLLVEKADQNE